MPDRETARRYTRRTLLELIGGIGTTVSVSGLVSANGSGKGRGNEPPSNAGNNGRGRGNGPPSDAEDSRQGSGPPSHARNICSDGLVRLAKYEVTGGEFVYEKDSDFLSVGDAFDLTVTGTKDGGEILAFRFEDLDDVYDVREISVKTGAGVFKKVLSGDASSPGGDANDGTYQGSFDARNYDEEHPVQAISNILLCSKIFWQVDFGLGPGPTVADYNTVPESTLLRAALGDSTDEQIDITDDGRLASGSSSTFEGVSSASEPVFSVDWSGGTVTVEFENNREQQVHLVSFERPGPFRGRGEFDAQELFDMTTTTAPSGSLTVDIPLPGDYF